MGWALPGDVDWRRAALWIALLITCSAGWLFKGHCVPGGWTDGEQYTTGCYNDVMPFWQARGVAEGRIPYLEQPIEYPVLTGVQIGLEGAATRLLFGKHARGGHFLGVVIVANAAIAGLILWMFLRAGMDRPRLWGWAFAPPLVLYLGHNWDLGAAALAVAALLLARENRLAQGAAAAALGAAAKLFPALALPPIGLAALFERGRSWRQRIARALGVTAAAIGAWLLVNAPVALLAPDNWLQFYRFSQERPGTVAGSWDVLTNMGWWFTWIEQRNLYAAAFFLGGAALILAIGWLRHRERMWVLATPILAWFMLTNKVYSPQFDLWLYPLLLMTAPRLLPVALFALGDIGAYFAEFWWLAGMEGHQPAASLTHVALAASVRAAVMLWLILDCTLLKAPGWIERAPG